MKKRKNGKGRKKLISKQVEKENNLKLCDRLRNTYT